MTLTYNSSLAKVKVKVKAHLENQGHKSNGLAVRVLTDRLTYDSNSMTSTADAGGNENHCSVMEMKIRPFVVSM